MAAAGPVLSPLELTRRRRAWAGWVRLGRLERAGLAVLALTTAVAVLAPLLAPYSPTTAVHAESFAPPGTHGLLVGSDELSRDLFSRVLYGIRASWLSALAVIASGVLIGGLIGTVAGIAGGWIDTALMRVTDLFLALPAAVLAIAVIAALGPSLPHTLVAVGIVWWPWYARIVRAEVRAQAVRSHVDAARLAGVGRARLALRHLLPGAFPAVLVTASLDVGSLVLILAGLSFIGLGSPPPAPSLARWPPAACHTCSDIRGFRWPRPLPSSCLPSPPTWPATASAISSKTTEGGTVSRRLPLLVAVLLAAVLLGSACSSTPPPTQGGSGGTLRLAYLADMAQADPDVFYDIEGNTVILSVYEGLLKYKPDSTEVIPSLAESWEVSPDGLTYTFHLRTGVKFQDGTPFNAQAVKTSFQRRLDVGAAPSYMLEPVASMQTPDETTFVVRLKHPVAPFLHYLASSWGPKIISPKALADNAGKDHAQTWAKEHATGTGPFQLTAFERGQRYELTRFDGYWGQKAHVDKVDIRIIPDIGTQRLQLQSGDLDAILHSFPQAELASVKSNPDLQVRDFSSFLNAILYLNTNKQPLSDPALRKALAGAINRDSLVKEVYGPYAKPSSSTYPSGLLDPALAPVAYPPSETTAPAGTGKLTFAYTADDSGVHRRLAELVQQRLDAAGFSVTINEVQLPQVFEYVNDLQATPDLVMQTNTPDGAHPDMWARIEWYSTGGLNYLGYKSPQADKALDQALETTDKATADRLYGEAGKIVAQDTAIIFIADPRDVMVLRKNLTGVKHVPNYPWALNLAALQKG